ncbi:ATP-dependent RNA helicase, partial [Pichia californica]
LSITNHEENHDQDHDDLTLDSNISKPYYSCSYCGISNTSCVVKCEICNKWFCNGKMGNRGSHIITHLVLSKHNSISLHPDGDLGDSILECYKCGNKNVFVLGFVSAKQDNVVVILCRLPCAQQKDLNWDTNEWQSLIEDRQLLSWVSHFPSDEDLINANSISYDQIIKLEMKWRLDKNATINDIEEKKEIEVVPILMRYTDPYQYQRSFAPLVKIEADYDKAMKESRGLNYISIDWSLSLNGKNLASFYFSTSDSTDLKVAVGDEMILRYDGPELNEPWEGRGYIIRLPDSHQEEYTLEMISTKNKPPIHILNRFTAEFVWKGISYERMQDAMKIFALEPDSISEYLSLKLLGQDVPDIFFDHNLPNDLSILNMPNLNTSQLYAVETALKSPLTLIQGPPGTGKTVTSATIVYHLSNIYKKEKILVCAPSNVAVDHLTEKLTKMGLKVVRIVAKSREDVDSNITKFCLHEQVKNKAKGEFKKLIKLKDELGELSKNDNYTYFSYMRKYERDLIENCDVVCCTCVGAKDKRLDKYKFRTVLIDESTQAAEPESLIPIVKGCKQLILVGDHQQLGPVILNKKASEAGLRQSLFERLIVLGHTPIRLEVQYRMHPALSEFPSNMFYDGSLQNGITNEDRQVQNSSFPWPIRDIPMMFWAVYGREEISVSGTSYLNRVEAMNVERIVTRLFKDGVKPSQIGIITPYEGQRNYILQYMQMNASSSNKELYSEIEVVSVDAFQGREKDYIILSCVRANSQQMIGFLRDPRRLNVALTRAKYGLMILGNPKALNRDKLWNHLLTFYRGRGCLVEGQIDNLQLSSVQLTRFIPKNNDFINSKGVNSSTKSNASFDTTSMVSYEGSIFGKRGNNSLLDDSKWPSLENGISGSRNNNIDQNYETDGNDNDYNDDDNDTIISYIENTKDNLTRSRNGNFKPNKETDELANHIKNLTAQFGGELTF